MEQDPPGIDNGGGGGLVSVIDNASLYGPSSAKRHRTNGPQGTDSPIRSSTPNHLLPHFAHHIPHPQQHPLHRGTHGSSSSSENRWDGGRNKNGDLDNNNKHLDSTSLLSQALEKQSNTRTSAASLMGGAVTIADDSASDTTSDRPESLMDGMIKTDHDSLNSSSLHRGLSSVSPATTSASNPLFPPGLEALYRQAGLSSAFLGLAANAAAAGGGGAGAGVGGGPGSGSLHGSTSPGAIPGITNTVPQVGLQSHAGNPNRKCQYSNLHPLG